MIKSILRFIRVLRSKPIGYWFGRVSPNEYRLSEGKVVQVLSTGDSRVVFSVNEMEYWSDDRRLKTVTIGLKNGKVLIIGDRSGKLASGLTDSLTTSRKRD